MSNNIYDIMKKLNAVESIDKPTQEPKNATLLESTMNQVLSEKYMGFDKVVASAKKGGARDPEAVAASIGRKKYGKEKFQKAAAAGKKLGENVKLNEKMYFDPGTGQTQDRTFKPQSLPQSNTADSEQFKADINTAKSGLEWDPDKKQVFPTVRNQGPGMAADRLEKRGVDIPGLIGNRVRQDTLDREMNEDDMEEGNKFTGNLAKARAKGLKKADLDGDGDMETVKEEKKETKTGTIHKAKPGRYGGYNPETDPDKDEYVEKKPRGRPPKEGGESAAEKEKREKREMTAKELQRWIVGSKPADFDEKEGTGTEYTKMASAEKAVSAYNKMREKGKSHSEALQDAAEKYDISQSTLNRYIEDEKLDEVAPPGKKAERMVKNIKKGFAKDGKVTPKEESVEQGVAEGRSPIPPNFPRSLAKKIYEHFDGDVNSTLITMWNIHNTVMENVAPSKKKINEGMSFEQATTKPANKPVVGTYKDGVWTADPPKKGEVGVPVPQNIDGGSAPPPTKPAKPVKSQKKAEVDTTDTGLAEMLNLAGIKNSISEAEIAECGMSPISGQYMDDAEGRMSINTNMSTDGNKSVTITADGDSAVELMKMLKMAGLHVDSSEDTDIEKMSEEKDDRYEANTTPEGEVLPIQTQLKGGDGEVAGKEKKMTPHGYQFADNPIAMKESMTLKLMKEYESIKKVK